MTDPCRPRLAAAGLALLLAFPCVLSVAAQDAPTDGVARADEPRTSEPAGTRPNILFIAVDDLRPEIAAYGSAHMRTPNLDRLAERSLLFERAYCMVPTCGASRAALFTGLRPTRNRFINYLTRASEDAPEALPLHAHLKANGYLTLSLGKIFHHADDHQSGWSEKPWRPDGPTYAREENVKKAATNPGRRKYGPPIESGEVGDDYYRDGKLAKRALWELEQLASQDKPFFLAVGFYKPHLPFIAPERYWDLYKQADIDLPENYHPPKNAPKVSIHTSGELRAYRDVPKNGLISRNLGRKLIRGYYSTVSYTDALIGKVLDRLDALDLTDNTIIVLWGDHGWNLGEHTLWCKHSCYETSMRAPLMISAPSHPGFRPGARTAHLTEFIDLYPTLCALTGLEKPDHLEGSSLVLLLEDPDAEVDTFAIGRYRDGDTIRTDRYRYTRYTDASGKPIAEMLYDHATDPDENVNLSSDPEHASTLVELRELLERNMGRN